MTASKILTNYLQLELQSELGSRESSFAGLDYLLNSNFNLTTGWRTTSAIKQENTNVGSFDFGINYRNTYFGYNLFPTKTSEDWQTIDLK